MQLVLLSWMIPVVSLWSLGQSHLTALLSAPLVTLLFQSVGDFLVVLSKSESVYNCCLQHFLPSYSGNLDRILMYLSALIYMQSYISTLRLSILSYVVGGSLIGYCETFGISLIRPMWELLAPDPHSLCRLYSPCRIDPSTADPSRPSIWMPRSPPLSTRPSFRRRFHRHYHRRVRFLHRRRPPPPRLDQGPSFLRRCRSFVSSGFGLVLSYVVLLWTWVVFVVTLPFVGYRALIFRLYPVALDRGVHTLDFPEGVGDTSALSTGDLEIVDIFLSGFDPSDPALWFEVSGFGSYTPRCSHLRSIPDEVLDRFCRKLDPVKVFHTVSLFRDPCASAVGGSPLSALYSAINRSSPSAFLASGGDSLPIVVDTGASTSLTPRRTDFITFQAEDSSIEGIGASSSIKGRGLVRWTVRDQHGVDATIVTMAVYVPDAPIRLYSPQYHFKEKMCGELYASHNEVRLRVPNGDLGDTELIDLSFPFHPQSNLPLILKQNHPSFLKSLFNCEDPAHVFTCVDSIRRIPVVEDVETTFGDDSLGAFLTDTSNPNLSSAQKELLVWHWKLGHVDMRKIQRLMHSSTSSSVENVDHLVHPRCIETRQSKTPTCVIPQCQACIQGKQTRRPTHSVRHLPNPDSVGGLSRGHCSPGSRVSMDQYVVGTKGRLYSSFGRESDKDRFSGGTIFRDHGSGLIFVHHQVSLCAGETIVGKRVFERFASSSGVKINSYHSDNGVFASKEFRSHCHNQSQTLDFSGVGSQHQNGCAERAIRTVFSLARALLIHSAIHWPDAYDLSLWPMAVDYATWVLNNLPGDDGFSPIEKFTSTKFGDYDHLRRTHVWGAPCYVLDPTLQNGQKLPKFKPRSRQGKFVGFSPDHSSNVGMILNRSTGKISPQFHVVFDDFFETVRGVYDANDIDLDGVDWDSFVTTTNTERYFDDSDDDHPPPPVHRDWLPVLEQRAPSVSPTGDPPTVRFHDDLVQDPVLHNPPGPLSSCLRPPRFTPTHPAPLPLRSEGARVNPPSCSEGAPAPVSCSEGAPASVIDLTDDEDDPSTPLRPPSEGDIAPLATTLDEARSAAQEGLRRSARLRQRNSRIYNEDFETGFFSLSHATSNGKRKFSRDTLDSFDIGRLNWDSSLALFAGHDGIINGDAQRFFNAMEYLEDPITGELDTFPTLALFNRAAANDNPRYHEAMNGPNREGFLDASVIEISTLQNIGAWTQVPRSSSMNILPSTWAFKIKRFPDGLVRKLKARFCVRGDKQIEGVDFFDTFAPVVQWSTVRLLLILSLSLGLVTTQVDYIAAFCQAPIEEDVFIELPLGWQHLNGLGIREKFKPGHVLKLNRSVYGLRQSPKNFFEHLKSNLQKCGFHQSSLDPCLFYSDKVICVTYVDDCLFFSTDKSHIDDAIASIKATGMDLQVEDDVAGFLGVHIKRENTTDDDGNPIEKITLLQTGLIDRIIAALGLDSSAKGVLTPAVATPLTKDLNGEPFDQSFNYASVVGMLMYLCNNSRPDLTFAVSQCARFTHSPTLLHATYLKRIGRYLLRTRSEGLTMTRSQSLDIDCYVDADFCGLFNHEDLQDPSSVKSRTGFVITVGKCPVIWSSKLQSEITLSTMEAEYVACSSACRELFPVRSLVLEIAENLHLSHPLAPTVHTTIWEDNNGALALAQMELPRTTPRSRHFSVKYHWFRSLLHSADPDRRIEIKKIGTLDQLGDLFTKGLGFALFQDLRKKLLGW